MTVRRICYAGSDAAIQKDLSKQEEQPDKDRMKFNNTIQHSEFKKPHNSIDCELSSWEGQLCRRWADDPKAQVEFESIYILAVMKANHGLGCFNNPVTSQFWILKSLELRHLKVM